MKRLKCLTILLILSGSSFVLSGCIPVMVGAVAYSSKKKAHNKGSLFEIFIQTMY